MQCFIHGLRPELKIRVKEKDTFKEVINDSIDLEQRLAANSALRGNKNMEHSKTDEEISNKNSKVTRYNVSREDTFICLRGSSTFAVSKNRIFLLLLISNLDTIRNMPYEGFIRKHAGSTTTDLIIYL